MPKRPASMPLALVFTLFAAPLLAGGEVSVVKKHSAKVVIADDSESDIFEIDGADLDVGESRQFFTEEGEEVVILRTETGFEISVGGDEITTDGDDVRIIQIGSEEATQVHVVDGDTSEFRVMSFEGGSEVSVDDGTGKRMVFVSTDDLHGDHDADHRVIWVDSGDAHGYSMGDHRFAVQYLRSSGALDKLDDDTRKKVLEALQSQDGGAQNP